MNNVLFFPSQVISAQFFSGVPVGTVLAFAGEISQNGAHADYKTPIEELGWLVCDGRELKRSEYPQLFATLGYLYGGTMNETFKLPNLSGMFLRGIGTDTASTESRTPAPGGGADGVGSTQGFALQKHVHAYKIPVEGTLPPGPSAPVPVVISGNDNAVTAPPTENIPPENVKVSEHETRPINTFIYYIIKYRY